MKEDKFPEIEYQTLRAEKDYRYEYASKMINILITFYIAIFTAGVALFAIYPDYIPQSEYYYTNTTIEDESTDILSAEGESNDVPSAEGTFNDTIAKLNIIFIQYMHAALFILPSFCSSILYHSTLENSVRIKLISIYFRNFLLSNCNTTWEKFKEKSKCNGTNYFYDSDHCFGNQKRPYMFVSISSIIISVIMAIITSDCFFDNPFVSWIIMPLFFLFVFIIVGSTKRLLADRKIEKMNYWLLSLIIILFIITIIMFMLIILKYKFNSVNEYAAVCSYIAVYIAAVIYSPIYQIKEATAKEFVEKANKITNLQ